MTTPSTRATVPGRRPRGARHCNRSRLRRVLNRVIRRFLRDMYIVRVTFGHARPGHATELRLGSKLVDVLRAAIPHAGPQAADHLVDEITQRPAIGDSPLHAFWNQ